MERIDHVRDLQNAFGYDNLNRLTSSSLSGAIAGSAVLFYELVNPDSIEKPEFCRAQTGLR